MGIPTTLIFDGNFMFFRSLHSAKGYGKMAEGKKFLDTEEEQNIFVRKVANDFVATINQFKGFNKVIFTKDSKSWRKEYYPEYKAPRNAKKAEDVNWDNFYKCMNRFCQIIEKGGIIVSTIEGAEGDDLLYLWSKYLNDKGENVIVITADGDLSQIIRTTDKVFTIVFNNKSAIRKIIAPPNFYEWLEERKDVKRPGLFDSSAILNKTMVNDGASMLSRLLDELNYEEVDPAEVALGKVICGDDGDNIPSIWEWGSIKPSGKYEKRITNKDFIKARDFLNTVEGEISIEKLTNNENLQNRIRIILENSGKTKIPLDKFKENLDRNLHLVVLEETFIPKAIQEGFDEFIEETDMSKQKFAFDRISMLAGTEFAKEATIKIVSDAY